MNGRIPPAIRKQQRHRQQFRPHDRYRSFADPANNFTQDPSLFPSRQWVELREYSLILLATSMPTQI